jgi:uncharacterized protein YndB with AHSA1/START domain
MSSRVPTRSAAGRAVAIRVWHRYTAPAERVFDAWLDPGIARKWLFATASRPMTHVRIDARVPGSFHFAERRNGERVVHSGEYVEIVPPRRLVFTLGGDGRQQAVTRVTVEIAPRRSGCELALTHEDVPADRAEHAEGRWTGMLYGLGMTLEPVSDISGRAP